MKSAQHTPGPWKVVASTPSLVEAATVEPTDSDDGCRIIAQALDPIPHIGTKAMWANARLIAAAPDLLAALKHVVHWHDQLSPADIAKAEAAIAKAEGARA